MKKKILLIDDDIDELFILNEALNDLPTDFACSFAGSVSEGVRMLNSLTPDYIFLDINMPGVNGFEGIAILLDLDASRNIPVIFYSTAVDDAVMAKAIRLGASGCVKKTDSIKSLSNILENLTSQIFV